MQKGLLCGLTNEVADFDNQCDNYQEDAEEKEQKLKRDLKATGQQYDSESLDPKKNKELGSVMFFVGIGVFFFTIMNTNVFGVVVLPIGAIVLGIRLYLKGAEQEKVLRKYMDLEEKKSKDIR